MRYKEINRFLLHRLQLSMEDGTGIPEHLLIHSAILIAQHLILLFLMIALEILNILTKLVFRIMEIGFQYMKAMQNIAFMEIISS